jgi:DNA-binding LacI/PurR family transcriptional regulator
MRKQATIQDVAEAVGIHKSTVSLALSGKGKISAGTRTRVMDAARALGYEPNPHAQRLVRGHRNNTVCIFNGGLDVGLATEKILRIQKALLEQSLDVPIYACPDTAAGDGEAQAAKIRQIVRQQPRAIICATQRIDTRVYDVLSDYQRDGGIVLSYDSPIPLACDQVIFDREDNGYQAARYLLERGHRRLGMRIGAPPGSAASNGKLDHNALTHRLRGFQRALAEYDVPLREEWLFLNQTPYEEGGAEIARQFLRLSDRPTGICIVNDYVALGFMVEVQEAGLRIPNDVSVIGLDNQSVARYCPVPLTAVSHPIERIARTVVEMLMARLNGDETSPPRTITIQGGIAERKSVAALL